MNNNNNLMCKVELDAIILYLIILQSYNKMVVCTHCTQSGTLCTHCCHVQPYCLLLLSLEQKKSIFIHFYLFYLELKKTL